MSDAQKENAPIGIDTTAMWSNDAENISTTGGKHKATPIDWNKVIGAATINMSTDEILDLIDRSPLGDTGIDLDTVELTHAPTVHWASRSAAVKVVVDRSHKTLDELVDGIAKLLGVAAQLKKEIATIRTIARTMENAEGKDEEIQSTKDC